MICDDSKTQSMSINSTDNCFATKQFNDLHKNNVGDKDSVISKSVEIPEKHNKNVFVDNVYSKSWNGTTKYSTMNNNMFYGVTTSSPNKSYNSINKYNIKSIDFNLNANVVNTNANDNKDVRILYDPINKCRSAGIIPYTIHENKLLFLFQKTDFPIKRKDDGWNDFGGKIALNESTFEIAAREFSEETSCLFYLKAQNNVESDNAYNILKNNCNLEYNADAIKLLVNLIPLSQNYFSQKISEYVYPLHCSSKETYISYFVKVHHIECTDIPNAEDIHIPYLERYKRQCKWFTINELINLRECDFHKRLQITKIQNRIFYYNNNNVFI